MLQMIPVSFSPFFVIIIIVIISKINHSDQQIPANKQNKQKWCKKEIISEKQIIIIKKILRNKIKHEHLHFIIIFTLNSVLGFQISDYEK